MTTNNKTPAEQPAASVAHPIGRGWISTGGTGAPNYDEFAADPEVTAAIEAQPRSVLSIEMPHCAPESVAAGHSFSEALAPALERLNGLRADGLLAATDDVVAPYRIDTAEGPAFGVFCLVDTDQISTSADEPGIVIRNEDVFVEKVRQRVALTQCLNVLLSPVLLLQSAQGEQLHEFLAELTQELGEPSVSDLDAHGQQHSLWLLAPGGARDQLLALAGTGGLIVADGNHRTLAAQQAGLPQFLAVITTPRSVYIKPYHRLLRELNGHMLESVLAALTKAGATVARGTGELRAPARAGTIVLYADRTSYTVTLPEVAGDVVERLDHSVVERLLLEEILGMDAGDKRITYAGGDYSAAWLAKQVDSGEQQLAVLIPPVTVDDFIAVNIDRLKMPRKSTWFTPKARAGLLAAEVSTDGSVGSDGAV